jgi:CheY-like chemotaxis protein
MERKVNERYETDCPEEGEDSWLCRRHGHALRNIFSIVIANAEMVGEEPGMTPQVQRRLARIVEACRRGEDMVHRIRYPHGMIVSTVNQPPSAVTGASSARILVLDDEADVVEIICRYLVKEGFVVRGVSDSKAALEMIRCDPLACDLVITDLDMPLLNGVELCRLLRAIRPELPVIMVTGYDRQVSEEQAADLGIKELLLKPLDRQLLLAAVRRFLIS